MKSTHRVGELVIHEHTYHKFMRYGKDFSNLIALYMFYNFHARRQGTNSPLATNNFVKRGLNWSLEKVKRI